MERTGRNWQRRRAGAHDLNARNGRVLPTMRKYDWILANAHCQERPLDDAAARAFAVMAELTACLNSLMREVRALMSSRQDAVAAGAAGLRRALQCFAGFNAAGGPDGRRRKQGHYIHAACPWRK